MSWHKFGILLQKMPIENGQSSSFTPLNTNRRLQNLFSPTKIMLFSTSCTTHISKSLAKLRFFCESIWNFVMMKMKQLRLPHECIWSFVMMKMKQQCSVYLWWSNLDPNSDLVPAKKNSQIYKQTSDEPELLHSSIDMKKFCTEMKKILSFVRKEVWGFQRIAIKFSWEEKKRVLTRVQKVRFSTRALGAGTVVFQGCTNTGVPNISQR
jgi:hypothetical protein